MLILIVLYIGIVKQTAIYWGKFASIFVFLLLLCVILMLSGGDKGLVCV